MTTIHPHHRQHSTSIRNEETIPEEREGNTRAIRTHRSTSQHNSTELKQLIPIQFNPTHPKAKHSFMFPMRPLNRLTKPLLLSALATSQPHWCAAFVVLPSFPSSGLRSWSSSQQQQTQAVQRSSAHDEQWRRRLHGGSRLAPAFDRNSHLQRAPKRQFWSSSGDDDGGTRRKRDRVKDAVKGVAKRFLPNKWFMSEEEQRVAQRRAETKAKLKANINDALASAPFGIRMMGRTIAPLLSGLASKMIDIAQTEQDSLISVLQQVEQILISDADVTASMGEPIRVGAPSSQAFSSSSINGRTSSVMDLMLPVRGSRAAGVARVRATNGEVANIQVQTGGRVITVQPGRTARGNGRVSGSSNGAKSSSRYTKDSPDIIDAEIVEKDKDLP